MTGPQTRERRPEQQEGAAAPGREDRRKAGTDLGPERLARYVGMPIFLALAGLALYLYIGTKELDNIEQRALNFNSLSQNVIQQIQLAGISTVIVVVLAVSSGILLTRPAFRRVGSPIIGAANIGLAVPSIGILAILAIVWSTGFWPAIVALVAYSFLPILRNTMVGLQQVDESVIESARGMGMTKTAVLFRIELPLAVPIILAGIRTALILNVGAATLATYVGAGGLGEPIRSALQLARYDTVLVVASGLTAILALSIDWLASVVEDILRPRGL
jgi:osmoprotectant transport system permease protein